MFGNFQNEMAEGGALLTAIEKRDTITVQRLLTQKADPNMTLMLGNIPASPLSIAISMQNYEAVRLLHMHGANIHERVMCLQWVYLVDYALLILSQKQIPLYLLEQGASYDPARIREHGSAAFISRIERRVSHCRRCAATFLCAPFRASLKLPRDVAVLLARAVWLHRRRDVWE